MADRHGRYCLDLGWQDPIASGRVGSPQAPEAIGPGGALSRQWGPAPGPYCLESGAAVPIASPSGGVRP
jgi:hypothetical protein